MRCWCCWGVCFALMATYFFDYSIKEVSKKASLLCIHAAAILVHPAHRAALEYLPFGCPKISVGYQNHQIAVSSVILFRVAPISRPGLRCSKLHPRNFAPRFNNFRQVIEGSLNQNPQSKKTSLRGTKQSRDHNVPPSKLTLPLQNKRNKGLRGQYTY